MGHSISGKWNSMELQRPGGKREQGLWGEEGGWGRLWETQESGHPRGTSGWLAPRDVSVSAETWTFPRGSESFCFATSEPMDFDSFDIERSKEENKTQSRTPPPRQLRTPF